MISSKGPSCEDRPILRRMRLEKGGVVDLAKENRSYFTNPKYRDKAAKIVQAW